MIWASLLSLGCGSTDYRAVDRQLDLSGRVPAQAEQVRVCVQGVGVQAFGARYSGRFAVTALPLMELPVVVTIDAVDGQGVIGQWQGALEEDYGLGGAVDCASVDSQDSGLEPCQPCQADGDFAAAQEESWVLGLRFLG